MTRQMRRMAKNLRARRLRLNLRQNVVAGAVGISNKTLANIEAFKFAPSLQVYVDLCQVLELPSPPLFSDEETAA
jgi:DNA-binding XRE family transcriptional regulator